MNQRSAGVLLHPTSLPNSNGGLGKLDKQAWKFIDWMQAAGLSVWQMLPLTQPHADLSPYQSVSAFAMNPALLPDNWQASLDNTEFQNYLDNEPFWLNDYALFMALKAVEEGRCWADWPDNLKYREPAALLSFAKQHQQAIKLLKQQQFMLQKLWLDLKGYANDKGIQLFGDMPIFVAYDSVDVWMNPHEFKLDENLQPTVVTGVPPDYFSETGQRWGNPHYDWQAMQANGFKWWKSRVEQTLLQFDLLRIDHFRGLQAAWEIQASEETAINGAWVEVPGEALLSALQEEFPNLPIIAEDLGVITPEVVALKEQFSLPGMAVLQFGFNGLPDNPHALDEQIVNSVAYTGTHDNDTTLGWFNELDEAAQQWVCEQISGHTSSLLDGMALDEVYQHMPWPLIIAGFNSPAQMVIIPLQDFLSLGTEHRMNVPGVAEGNWSWQFAWSDFPKNLAETIHELLIKTARLNPSINTETFESQADKHG